MIVDLVELYERRILRLYSGDINEYRIIIGVIDKYLVNVGDQFDLNSLSFVESKLNISLAVSKINYGATLFENNIVLWRLTSISWKMVSELFEPFSLNVLENSFQWLGGEEARFGLNVGAIEILLSGSPDGRW